MRYLLILIALLLARPSQANCSLQALVRAYPSFLCGTRDANTLIWCDGTTTVFSDGVTRTFQQQLDDPDLKDQLAQAYPWHDPISPPPKNFDPGRIRYEPLFRKMYGNDSAEVSRRLSPVKWLPGISDQIIYVTGVNGVADKLQQISNELAQLSGPSREMLRATPETFLWRPIAGTNRLSMHSFGIALDIAIAYSNYWRWDGAARDPIPFRNRIPADIVDTFERHGFIWGGRWYHYDTMHFEYRPDLLRNEGCRAAP